MRKRFLNSKGLFIRYLLVLYDILVVNFFAYCFFDFNEQELYFFSDIFTNDKHVLFFIYSSILWLFSSYLIGLYKVYYTTLTKISSLLVKQMVFFCLVMFSFIGVFRSINIIAWEVLRYTILSFFTIGGIRLLIFYVFQQNKYHFDDDIKNIVIVGDTITAKSLRKIMLSNKTRGYKLKGMFSDTKSLNINGTINQGLKFIDENLIDEIYCAIDELDESQISAFVKSASKNNILIKFIPDSTLLNTRYFITEYYHYLPILSSGVNDINKPINALIKRLFDIIFSFFVIIIILLPASLFLYILLTKETSGSLIYKHKRNGINYKEFTCYKFRTLNVNTKNSSEYVKKCDDRVSRLGNFLRKTSLDELPQFYNVIIGNMSIVGPRPHMLPFTEEYAKKVDKYSYTFRHSVKPGITGLAQVSGYRGEIKNDDDIIGRIKYDIFYIENWSLLLDLKIIIQTIIKAIKGDEKAY